MPNEYLQKVVELSSTAGIAMVWWFGHNLYLMRKGRKFTMLLFCLNILLAGFVGYTVGKFIPESAMRDWILAISGFSSFPILAILEEKGADLVLKYMWIDMREEKRRKEDIK